MPDLPTKASAALARRRNYHVGNVRSQLLTAAREILETQGKDALSLRAIAEDFADAFFR